ncbi:glycosyltransferase family 2 protein [Desulfovibrio inopinatus]|uniref:glycosyltransferase family 2 protein n=1 Tax=Desulfovibrio inopinatus TaxID=102109 RepID=UPI00041FC7C7|nr:glycosyltransferase family 2 protein [Desulfovibrio inopinatus]
MPPHLSVVVLCYKAKEQARPFTAKVVEQVESITSDWEIVLVGNYNAGDETDTTPHVVRELASSDPRIKALTLVKEGMMGWDARTGLDAATGDIICLIDGDEQMPPEDIQRVYDKLKAEGLDVVSTYRADRRDGLVRRLNSQAYNLVFRILFPGLKSSDINSKPKIFTRAFFEKLNLVSDDWFLDAEIMIQVRRYGAAFGEIPTVFHEAKNRRSFVRLGAVMEFVSNLVRARLREFTVKR